MKFIYDHFNEQFFYPTVAALDSCMACWGCTFNVKTHCNAPNGSTCKLGKHWNHNEPHGLNVDLTRLKNTPTLTKQILPQKNLKIFVYSDNWFIVPKIRSIIEIKPHISIVSSLSSCRDCLEHDSKVGCCASVGHHCCYGIYKALSQLTPKQIEIVYNSIYIQAK